MADSDGGGDFKLSDVYDQIWSIYEELENSSDSSSSDKYQNLVARGVLETERAVHIVNDLSLFSNNEHIDEVASNDIRYIILPGLLGYFTNKNQKIDRFDAVCKSQTYFIDFLRLCKMYELTDCDLPQPYAATSGSDQQTVQSRSKSAVKSLEDQTKKRERKIEQLKRRRELEQTLKELTSYVKQEHADDENIRQFYLTLVNKWLSDAFDNLDSFEAELPILEHMAKMKESGQKGGQEKRDVEKKSAPLRPFIITKNELQKKVFGIGYPSIPTVTVDEFYDQRVREGLFPSAEHSHQHAHPPAAPVNPTVAEAEQEEKDAEAAEVNAENDDEESLRRQRNWDDWKDDHRRGWGNTQNKG